jgi:hypothetical protein
MRRYVAGCSLLLIAAIAVAADDSVHRPVYEDWEFWSAVWAGIAILLSQLPPVVQWFRPRRRLDVEMLSRIVVNDKIGNPNVGIYLAIRNAGQVNVRVRSMQISIQRDGVSLGDYPAQNYFEMLTSKNTVLLTAFTIKPNESWEHTVNFLRYFDRATEKWYRKCESALREDIQEKIAQRDSNAPKTLVEARPELAAPFADFFEKIFVWTPGEYAVEFILTADHSASNVRKRFRFTLFESDTMQLRSYVDDYKYGAGITWMYEKNSALLIPITPLDGE